MSDSLPSLRARLQSGHVIPAHPLALTAQKGLSERHQRALARYYLAAGAGGLAVGVHTTQFEIHGTPLLEQVLKLAADEVKVRQPDALLIAGAVGGTEQAMHEAALARDLGYDAVLLSLGAWREASVTELIAHCRAVAEVMPLIGFYLQPAVGGRVLPYEFWRAFFDIEDVVAVKAAPFQRYWTLDLMRALSDSGRAGDIALYTGNDDHILLDLLLPTQFSADGPELCFTGGLLGQWSVWTRKAVQHLAEAKAHRAAGSVPMDFLRTAQQLTDANEAIFDVTGNFKGSIAGIGYVLHKQGLMPSYTCLSDHEVLSPGQMEEIDRVWAAYPHLTDDEFVQANRESWLND